MPSKSNSRFLRILILTTLCGLLSAPATWAAARARANPNAEAIHHLFDTPLPQVQAPAKHTFVFWVNGAQDDFEPTSSVPTNAGDAHPRLYRADSVEVSKILEVANSCPACNIVILHAQRGGAKWYTSKKPWATYLRVYSRGHFLLQRHVDEVDETDPRLLAWLLNFSQGIFPQSELHLIYRGHSFKTAYTPGSHEILPFDYNHPDHGYGEKDFLTSLHYSGLVKPLASVVFAGCSMASIELAAQLPQYAQYFVGSEVEVLEVLDVSFRFNSLMQVTDAMSDREVSWLVAWRLLEAFDEVPILKDAMMEYPTTWTDLSGMRAIAQQFDQLSQSLEAMAPAQRDSVYSAIKNQGELTKGVSNRFIESLRKAGKSQAVIDIMVAQVRMPSENRHDLELGQVLNVLMTETESEELKAPAAALRDLIKSYVTVINPPAEASVQIGLNVDFQDAPLPLLPSL